MFFPPSFLPTILFTFSFPTLPLFNRIFSTFLSFVVPGFLQRLLLENLSFYCAFCPEAKLLQFNRTYPSANVHSYEAFP